MVKQVVTGVPSRMKKLYQGRREKQTVLEFVPTVAARKTVSPRKTIVPESVIALSQQPAAAPVEAPSTRGSYDGNTAFELYLNEIGRVKLLTPEQEIVLAKKIQRGDKQAREDMIKANLRLVVKIAREYE